MIVIRGPEMKYDRIEEFTVEHKTIHLQMSQLVL